MKEFLQLMTIFGVFFLAVSILLSNNAMKNKLTKKYSREKILQRFDSKRMSDAFKDSGITLPVRKVNLVRYAGLTSYVVLDFIFRFLTSVPFSLSSVMLAGILLLATEPLPFTPASYFIQKYKARHQIQIDSNLIGLMKLYENNRLRTKPLPIKVFLKRVSGQFLYINNELKDLSERIIDKDLETSLNWWVKRYPSDHEFISQIRTIILTSESLDPKESASYLKTQSQFLTKLASEQYRRRGMQVGDNSKIFNTLPTLITMAMVIYFVFMYLDLIRSQLQM